MGQPLCWAECSLRSRASALWALAHFFGMHAEDVLLIAFGSVVPEVVFAESHTVPTAERQGTVMETVALAPAARLGQVQVTVDPATLQVPPALVTIDGGGPENALEVVTRETF